MTELVLGAGGERGQPEPHGRTGESRVRRSGAKVVWGGRVLLASGCLGRAQVDVRTATICEHDSARALAAATTATAR